MGEHLDPFVRRSGEVSAEEILNAIAEGRDIEVTSANIVGRLHIQEVAGRLERSINDLWIIRGQVRIDNSVICGEINLSDTEFWGSVSFEKTTFCMDDIHFERTKFCGDTSFSLSRISGRAHFTSAIFMGRAYFDLTVFGGNGQFTNVIFEDFVSFHEATFTKLALFGSANFGGYADFSYAKFGSRVSFRAAYMKRVADFAHVVYDKNNLRSGLQNEILCRIVNKLTNNKIQLSERQVTKFDGFNTATLMDGASNPYLKRYIDDEQWIDSWRRSGKLQEKLFYIWEATSHCGRSISLWAGLSFFLILFFSVIFTPAPHWWPEWWWGFWREHGIGTAFEQTAKAFANKNMNFLDGFYLSIVSFTTLGFGDIIPANRLTRALLGLEVVLGYVMLGGLISIFANKFARRS